MDMLIDHIRHEISICIELSHLPAKYVLVLQHLIKVSKNIYKAFFIIKFFLLVTKN